MNKYFDEVTNYYCNEFVFFSLNLKQTYQII